MGPRPTFRAHALSASTRCRCYGNSFHPASCEAYLSFPAPDPIDLFSVVVDLLDEGASFVAVLPHGP